VSFFCPTGATHCTDGVKFGMEKSSNASHRIAYLSVFRLSSAFSSRPHPRRCADFDEIYINRCGSMQGCTLFGVENKDLNCRPFFSRKLSFRSRFSTGLETDLTLDMLTRKQPLIVIAAL